MPPTEEDLNQLAADLLPGQQTAQQAMTRQQHDLDRIRLGNRKKGAVRIQKPVGSQTVNMRVEPGRVRA